MCNYFEIVFVFSTRGVTHPNLAFQTIRIILNKMKRLPIAFLSVLAIVLAGYSGFLNMENQRLKHQLADSSNMREAPMKIAEGKETETFAAVEEPRPEALDRGGRFEEFKNLTQEEITERRREARAAQLARALEAFEDPELRMDMIERQMQRLDRGYADFFKQLNLTPEELDALKTLMAELTLLRMEGGLRASAASDEKRKALREDYSNQMVLLSGDINGLLGEEDAKKLTQYKNTLEYRGEVENFERSLSYTDTPLNERQAEGLIKAFAKVDKDFEYTVDIKDNRGRGRGDNDIRLTKEVVDTYYREREIYDAILLEQASKMLNEAQLASLAAQKVSERERDYRQAQQVLENPVPTDGRGGLNRGGFGGFQGSGRGGPGGGGRGR